MRTASIRDLAELRKSDSGWEETLALVQRDEKWDDRKDAYLIDSLLRGYPIGSLLFCRVGNNGLYRLVDGQQRVTAIHRVFMDADNDHGLYLKLGAWNTQANPGAKAQKVSKVTSYLAREGRFNESADQSLQARRHDYIDLKLWPGWAASESGKDTVQALIDGKSGLTAQQLGTEIDPEFAPTNWTQEREKQGLVMLRGLAGAWSEESVPLIYADINGLGDLLEVFTRLNTAGVRVSGTDLYLAGVKTIWQGAGQGIKDISDASNDLLDAISALELCARLATLAAGRSDPIPLSLDKLGEKREEIVENMQDLATLGSSFLMRLEASSRALTRHSHLKEGLRFVRRSEIVAVLAWSVLQEDAAVAVEESIDRIDAFLVGATLFKYRSILKDKFQRAAMSEAVSVALRDEKFPAEGITLYTRQISEALKSNGRTVANQPLLDERLPLPERFKSFLPLANGNRDFILSVSQKLEYGTRIAKRSGRGDHRAYDWDHIFPRVEKRLMKWPAGHQGAKKPRFHTDAGYINRLGNFWALPLATNRSLQAKLPRRKFSELERGFDDEGLPIQVLPRNQWALTDEEISRFGKAGQQIAEARDANDAVAMDAAMRLFTETVQSREVRLINDLLQAHPRALDYGADADLGHASDHDTPRTDPTELRERLGLSARWDRSRLRAPHSP